MLVVDLGVARARALTRCIHVYKSHPQDLQSTGPIMAVMSLLLVTAVVCMSLLLAGDVELNPGPLTKEGELRHCGDHFKSAC